MAKRGRTSANRRTTWLLKTTLGHKVLPHWAKPLWANTCREEKRKEGREEREVEEEMEKIVRRGEKKLG